VSNHPWDVLTEFNYEGSDSLLYFGAVIVWPTGCSTGLKGACF